MQLGGVNRITLPGGTYLWCDNHVAPFPNHPEFWERLSPGVVEMYTRDPDYSTGRIEFESPEFQDPLEAQQDDAGSSPEPVFGA